MTRKHSIEVGDTVAYTPAWLHSTGQILGEVPHYKGIVHEITRLGEQTVLVTVAWTLGGLPVLADGSVPWTPTVNILNVARFGTARSVDVPIWASEGMNGRGAKLGKYALDSIERDRESRRKQDEALLAEYADIPVAGA